MFRVTVRETGKSFPCGPGESVLSAMIRSKCGPIAHGCCGGGCGVCRMQVNDGQYEKVKEMSRAHVSEREEEEGIILLCCVQPRSDLLISRNDSVALKSLRKNFAFG